MIPCHNDCGKAEKQRERLMQFTDAHVFVAHNGCSSGVPQFPWSNKARMINYIADNRNEPFIISVDADVVVESDIVFAFKEAMMRGVRYGSVLMAFSGPQGEIDMVEHDTIIAGAAWFCERQLIVDVRLDETIAAEDTAFTCALKKKGIEPETIIGAVVRVYSEEPTFSKQFRQGIRYQLAGYQLMSKKLMYSYGVSSYLAMTLNLVAITVVAFGIVAWFNIVLVYFALFFIGLSGYKDKQSKRFIITKRSVTNFLDWTVVPFVAYYAFLRKRWVW